MEIHKGIIYSMEKDNFEKRIITTCSDGKIRVFENKSDPDTKINLEFIAEMSGDEGIPTKAVFVDQIECIVASFSNGTIIIWKKENINYKKIYEFKVFSGSISDLSCVYIENNIVMYCACSDGILRIVKYINNTIQIDEVTAHRFGISCIDGNEDYIVTGGIEYSVAIWSKKEEITRFNSHEGVVRAIKIAPKNIFNIFCFASCGEDGKVIIYIKDGNNFNQQIIELEEPVYSLSWSKSGFSLSVGYGENKYKCFVPTNEGKFEEIPIVEE
ncbi:protein transport protein sec13 [Vairimorpha apis BRL 01]|uniref:Protein transport protein sec13 n=1 Tax=Vairimorpha apis BRL 01 TaxID=1037528 RepID=T0L7S4_9MICR|nr:protein transport protein sec13 [Vairimorpha apis BRL 01]